MVDNKIDYNDYTKIIELDYNKALYVLKNINSDNTSVIKTIKVAPGKHYLKFVATSGGFNINYFRIQKDFTDVNDLKVNNVAIYPNPELTIPVENLNDFQDLAYRDEMHDHIFY